MRARQRRVAAVVCALVLVLTGAACTGDDDGAGDDGAGEEARPTAAPTTPETPPPGDDVLGAGDGLARYTRQSVEWSECSGEFECATVLVPLDYADLSGDTVGIAVSRLPATDSDAHLGSLLLNPGGPGGSGVEFVRQASAIV